MQTSGRARARSERLIHMTRSEYLKAKGFCQQDHGRLWINEYCDPDAVVGVLDFTAEYGYGYTMRLNDCNIFSEWDIEFLQDRLSELRDIYYKAFELEDK